MTREQLDAIRARVAWLEENGGIGLPFAEARALLDEVERLKAREEALVQQSVAQIGLSGWQYKQIERLKGDRSEINTAKLNDAFTEGTLKAGDAMRPLVAAAFQRGVAAMREAAAKECWKASDVLADIPDMTEQQGELQILARRIRALPDPEDK